MPAPTCPRELANRNAQRISRIFQSVQLQNCGPTLEEFVKRVFSDHNILDAYFLPKSIWDFMGEDQPITLPASGDLQELIPLDVASHAATQAMDMDLIKPAERFATQVAAFLYPCGLFYYALSQALPDKEGTILSYEQIGTLRGLLLERPLQYLREQDPGMGDTLTAVLGLAVCEEDVSLAQVARISSAVYIANLKVSSIWGQS